ncbi:hypothetical protein [Amycolatopsis rubida]|uniref:Uncharacterized protein n=1 Tax=Amycolatopsis rubida TaxID=112413 RepID=A0A1I5EIV6_9PSEU|nr:hypothetical protein [Amycolatopsis rubida]SFO11253.1 hypothetical protein SAMN05421854_101657 [Amycolatopsis rubida]
MNSARDESGLGITASYWPDEESIAGCHTNLRAGTLRESDSFRVPFTTFY